MKQQNDPIAQAMQILQLVTQRRGQQADIDQGNRRLDMQEQQFDQGLGWEQQSAQMKNEQFARDLALRELAQQQGMDQFNRRLGMDQKQIALDQQKFEADQQNQMLNRALEQSRFAQTFQTDQAYKQSLVRQGEFNMSQPDPQMLQIENDRKRAVVEFLHNQVLNAPNKIEASRYNDQLQAYLKQWLGNDLPPLRPYSEAEQNMMNSVTP